MKKPKTKQEQPLNSFFDRLSEISEVLNQEQKEYKALLKNQVALRGKILTYHLVSEKLITQELLRLKENSVLKAKGNIRNMRYSEKLAALPRQVAYSQIRKGFKELNEIRNKMAHDLSFCPDLVHIPNLIRYMNFFDYSHPNRKPNNLEEYLHYFLRFSIVIFASRSGNSRKELDKLMNEFPITKFLLKRLFI